MGVVIVAAILYIIFKNKTSTAMYEQKLKTFSQLPVKCSHPHSQDKNRKCTDVLCTVLSALFAITMFVLAFVLLNRNNYYMTNFPTDSDGQPCSIGDNQRYDYIYLPDFDDPQTRVCVNSCPKVGATVHCRRNSRVKNCLDIKTYESSPQFDRLGGFCVPTEESAKQKLITTLNLEQKWSFLRSYDSIKISLVVALGFSLLWFLLVHMLPRMMAPLAIFLGSMILLASGLIVLLDQPQGWQGRESWKFVIAIACIFFSLLFLVMLGVYRKRVTVTGILLDHATKFINQQAISLIFIPIFIIFSLGLIILCLFQYLAYSSNSAAERQEDDIYLNIHANPILLVLNIIEFIWGMQFLKDSFNFLVSGNATEWYGANGQPTNCCLPLQRLVCRNWGSVAGGSFLNAFFNFFDFLWEAFRCYPQGICGKCASCCTSLSQLLCCNFFDLIRNDSYAYINLTGIPYCNSARNCQVLCHQSSMFIGNQSVMFFYRLCAHAFCVGATTLCAYFMIKQFVGAINLKTLVIVLLLSYCIVTYFVDMHADAAEALQVSYLTELQVSGGNPQSLPHNKQGLKGDLSSMKHSYDNASC